MIPRCSGSSPDIPAISWQTNENNIMEVYAIVTVDWNLEYGYDEYSKPIEIVSDKELAERIKAELKELPEYHYCDIEVIPYTLK